MSHPAVRERSPETIARLARNLVEIYSGSPPEWPVHLRQSLVVQVVACEQRQPKALVEDVAEWLDLGGPDSPGPELDFDQWARDMCEA